TELDEKQVARAAVESVAENTVDAVVAPALWAAAAGGRGALGYRAANTLDAMVGHRSARYRKYGWASARLDDVAGWLPAPATAATVRVWPRRWASPRARCSTCRPASTRSRPTLARSSASTSTRSGSIPTQRRRLRRWPAPSVSTSTASSSPTAAPKRSRS